MLFLAFMGKTGLTHDIFSKFSLRPFKVVEAEGGRLVKEAYFEAEKKKSPQKIQLSNFAFHVTYGIFPTRNALKLIFVFFQLQFLSPYNAQCGGLSLRCHRVTVYRDIKIRRTSERTCRCRLDSSKVILSHSYYFFSCPGSL